MLVDGKGTMKVKALSFTNDQRVMGIGSGLRHVTIGQPATDGTPGKIDSIDVSSDMRVARFTVRDVHDKIARIKTRGNGESEGTVVVFLLPEGTSFVEPEEAVAKK